MAHTIARPPARVDRAGAALGALLLLALPAGPGAASPDGARIVAAAARQDARLAAIAERLAGRPADDATIPPADRPAVARLYALGGGRPQWIDAGGRPSRNAVDALALLAGAAADGLDPVDYRVAALSAEAGTIARLAAHDDRARAAFDVGLSVAVLRYLRHLHLGRVDPRAVAVGLRVDADSHDFVRVLHEALAAHDLPARAAGLAPAFAQYGALRAHLARLRQLAVPDLDGGAAWPVMRAGERHEVLVAIRQRLRAFGDLAGAATPAAAAEGDGARFDERLVEGIRRFQARHGLAEDGVIGAATQAALRTPVQRRIRQIALAMERLRWLPDAADDRVIVLNIPMFRLWAWGGAGAAEPGPSMRVIVGRAPRTQTPVFVADMRTVIFRPYWNVPASILRHEMLPAIERNPGLLARPEFEILRGDGGTAAVASGPAALAGLRDGSLRLRQRPGPTNPLGQVKFELPNESSIYLHGTSAPALFERPRRDFSHGCIRIEAPDVLAEWVLRSEPGWTRERIAQAMTEGPLSQTVTLSRPIRVVLFYTTAAVVPEDGTIHFADDIYRHDARLEQALSRR